jgi:DNA-binding response OmpR family regulator
MAGAREIRPTNRPLTGPLILLVDNNGDEDSYLEELLWVAGARVVLAETAYQATIAGRNRRFTAAVLDINVGNSTIDDVCAQLDRDAVPWIVLPSPDDPNHANAVIDALINLLCIAPHALGLKIAL